MIHDEADLRRLADEARTLAPTYGGDDAALLTVSENATFRIDGGGRPLAVLRFYRPGHRTAAEISAEIAWIEALRADGVVTTPKPLEGRDGTTIRRVGASRRIAVAFAWVDGRPPAAEAGTFRAIGTIAARLHAQVARWTLPSGRTRPPLATTVAGWGDWTRGAGLEAGARTVIARALAHAERQLAEAVDLGAASGLIHTDLRVANLLADGRGRLVVLDFDDAATGLLAADLAGSVSFGENDASLPARVRAWCDGYAEGGGRLEDVVALLPAVTLRRRVQLLAWIATHPETAFARTLAGTFAEGTASVARRFLDGRLLGD